MPQKPKGSKDSSNTATTYSGSPGATGGPESVGLQLTSSESLQMYHHFTGRIDTLGSHMDAMKTQVKGELAGVVAALKEAETQRSGDFRDIKREFEGLKKDLPTKESIRTSTRNWALSLGVFLIALGGLLWAVFGTGASMTGALADRIVDTKQDQRHIESKLDCISQRLQNPKIQCK